MAKRGRPKQSKFKDPEKRKAYYRKRYRDAKKNNPTWKDKDALKVLIVECVPMTKEDIVRFPHHMRRTVHRYKYCTRPGSISIPEEYLDTNEDMVQYVGEIVGEGEWLIKSGYAHKVSKRVTWRALIRFRCIETHDNIKCQIIKTWPRRLALYWFRKRLKSGEYKYGR